jgi:hypothetical protein
MISSRWDAWKFDAPTRMANMRMMATTDQSVAPANPERIAIIQPRVDAQRLRREIVPAHFINPEMAVSPAKMEGFVSG